MQSLMEDTLQKGAPLHKSKLTIANVLEGPVAGVGWLGCRAGLG